MAHTLQHLGPPIEAWWADLGQVKLTPELNQKLVDGVNDELRPYDQAELIKKRDALLLDLLMAKEKTEQYI